MKLAVFHEESRSKSNEHLPQRLLETALDRRQRWRFETVTPTAATSAHREPVREIWGMLPLVTCTTIKNTIAHLTKVNNVNDTQVEQQFISRQSTRSGKGKWWFVLHGDENSLKFRETTWETVKLQTV